jgi:hypothetical protein
MEPRHLLIDIKLLFSFECAVRYMLQSTALSVNAHTIIKSSSIRQFLFLSALQDHVMVMRTIPLPMRRRQISEMFQYVSHTTTDENKGCVFWRTLPRPERE